MRAMAGAFIIATAAIFASTEIASAIQFDFHNITNNNQESAWIGESQLHLDVSEAESNQILFLFTNTGPLPSSITEIYFEDSISLLTYSNIIQSTGVHYISGATPDNPPGGNQPEYKFSSDYSYESSNPSTMNGINPGEQLSILFNVNDATFSSLLDAIYKETLRVALHAKGFPGGHSESFINTHVPAPEPPSILLFGLGVFGVAAIARRRRSDKKGRVEPGSFKLYYNPPTEPFS